MEGEIEREARSTWREWVYEGGTINMEGVRV